jgi:alpha-glucosidase (family GH31 glycosyl hydrolase)
MFGPEILVALVLYEGARERDVYLPAGTHWMAAASGANYAAYRGRLFILAQCVHALTTFPT